MKTYILHQFIAATLFLSLYFQNTFTQEPPIEWGKIPKEDLAMKTFPQDSNASALILCDYGQSYFNDDLDIIYNRHMRIKILTTKGYKWGNHSVVIYSHQDAERIYDIEGVTYFIDSTGNTITKELDENDIFEEKIDSRRTMYKFTLPMLKPGCIVEIRYTIKNMAYYTIRDWVFQYDEPVIWSEYKIRFPGIVSYSAFHQGFVPYTVYEITEVNQRFSGFVARLLGQDYVRCTQMRWAVQNAPALRDEPFITTMEDNIQKVNIQLSGYVTKYNVAKSVHNDWNTTINELLEDEDFGQRIEKTSRIQKLTEEITAGLSSPEEKMKAVYNWISKSIVYSGENRLYAYKDMDDILKLKTGNDAEITFLLLSMLKSIGIDGDPVILSTRNNGKVHENYPVLSEFNYVLAKITLGNKSYFIDATNPLRPLDLLPLKVLNVRGLVIKKDVTDWVTLASPKRYSDSSLITLNILEDGSCTGTIEDTYKDYSSLLIRNNIKDKKDISIAKERFKIEEIGITIDSAQIEGKDSINNPLKIKAWFSSSSYLQQSGNLIYINPHIITSIKENPLKAPKREFPVDYPYELEQTIITDIKIPPDYKVKERISNRSLIVGPNSVRYIQKIQIDEDNIRIIGNYEIRKIQIGPEFYERLKDLYGQIVMIQSQQLVLERKETSATTKKTSPGTKPIKKKGKK